MTYAPKKDTATEGYDFLMEQLKVENESLRQQVKKLQEALEHSDGFMRGLDNLGFHGLAIIEANAEVLSSRLFDGRGG